MRRNNSFQAHCPYQNKHGKEYNREFPGHFASGDERHPETLYPLLQGCQGTRVADLFRIGTHLPARPFARLSPIADGAVNFTTRRE